MPKLFVISLGGSLIVPDQIDSKFLKNFSRLITIQARLGKRFIISPGGGKTCRRYQQALRDIVHPSPDDLDIIGLNTNRFHAILLEMIFKSLAEKNIAYDPNKKLPFRKKILIGAGGWKPGRSSDDYSVRLAKVYNADCVINLFDQDYVYERDPRRFPHAKKIEHISWKNFCKIVGTKWNPGTHVPFDPIAAKFAEKHGLKVVMANGRNLDNLKNILNGKKFQGTTIA